MAWLIEPNPAGGGVPAMPARPAVLRARPSGTTVLNGRRIARREALPPEISFLEGRHVDRGTLSRAAAAARRWRVSPEQVLLNTGLITQITYYRALGAHLGLSFSRLPENAVNWRAFKHPKGAAMARANIVPLARTGEGLRVAIAPQGRALRRLVMLSRRPDATRALRNHLIIATPGDVAGIVQRGRNEAMLAHACRNLADSSPASSAASGLGLVQASVLAVSAAVCLAALAAAPAFTLAALAVVLAVIFAAVNILRTMTVLAATRARGRGAERAAPAGDAADFAPGGTAEEDLPVYTLLVPLLNEAAVLPQLVKALRRLDYPAAKLDIKLIFEAHDRETLAAAQALRLPAGFHRVVVPPGGPRTKPKALNFALQLARGSLVAVYDAEDRPEPNQLRRAVAAFAAGPPELACVQAPLGFYNTGCNWLTRQFGIEYAALFDAQLPALEALRLPIPLGGTSNHFRRDRLEEVGAWDPYNVTEDADLGIRLARRGYRCAMLNSRTFEEACGRLPGWLGQRTRWIKGWLQTYFVHMRAPLLLWRELGPKGFIAFNVLIAGTVVSALAHPVFSAAIVYALMTGLVFAEPPSPGRLGLAAINTFNLTVGYTAAILLGWLGVKKRGLNGLAAALKWMPVYWLLISLAAYHALWELARRPFHWDKTEHGGSRYRLLP